LQEVIWVRSKAAVDFYNWNSWEHSVFGREG